MSNPDEVELRFRLYPSREQFYRSVSLGDDFIEPPPASTPQTPLITNSGELSSVAEEPMKLNYLLVERGSPLAKFREVTYYPAYPIGFKGGFAPSETYNAALKRALADYPREGPVSKNAGYSWGAPYIKGDRFEYAMLCVLPIDLYNRLAEPDVNEYGEVSP